MSDDQPAAPRTDKSVRFTGNSDGTQGHYSGEEYDSYAKANLRDVEIGVSRDNRPAKLATCNAKPGEVIPPDAGKRAYIDEKTGEVHGSGAGAGGGNPTEDFDVGTGGGG